MVEYCLLYSVLYSLFCICIMFPPPEFISAGVTIPNFFSYLLGDERFDFIEYHLRRTLLTIAVHSFLPLGYFISLELVQDEPIFVLHPRDLLHWLAHLSVLFFLGTLSFATIRYLINWKSHPIIKNLLQYDRQWKQVADSINSEYRDIENYTLSLAGNDKVILTNSWILSCTNYSVRCAQVSDTRLKAIRADEHPISLHRTFEGPTQYVDIEVQSVTDKHSPFVIRIRSDSFRDIRAKLSRPIEIARDIVFKQSLNDRFVAAFVEQVHNNPRSISRSYTELEPCLGCTVEVANVKLTKNCVDVEEVDEEGRQRPNCSQCYCRPMWCETCMARIFAAKQDQGHPENWIPGKATCPTCRAVFCIFDVSLIDRT
ncbi:hypothetical protein AB6A40_004392 [Gnathostoma spinigerum]|uniref:Transmembrane protein 129 n=1 Tax=Gnathostoma spinigerum TaxID=75299 RepID=A0ABD6EL46_9BILA